MKSFNALQLIRLPRFTLEGGLALGRLLMAEIRAVQRVPPVLKPSMEKLEKAHGALSEAKRERARVEPVEEARMRLRREEGGAWRALDSWLTGWMTLDHGDAKEQREAASRLDAALFSGPPFSRRRFEVAWAEADERLKMMEEKKYKAAIETLGAEVFLDRIREAHRASGELLGITKAKPLVLPPEGPRVKELLGEFREAMREYVVQVTAYGLTGANSKALAERLLAPIAEWREAPRARAQAAAVTGALPATPAVG